MLWFSAFHLVTSRLSSKSRGHETNENALKEGICEKLCMGDEWRAMKVSLSSDYLLFAYPISGRVLDSVPLLEMDSVNKTSFHMHGINSFRGDSVDQIIGKLKRGFSMMKHSSRPEARSSNMERDSAHDSAVNLATLLAIFSFRGRFRS